MGDLTVSIVIPNFNGENLLKKNLPDVVSSWKNPKNKIQEVIVVDDNSGDSSINFIKKNFSEVRIIKHSVNRGFSSAVNTGVRMAKSALVCLLNTDVSPTKNFLENTIKHFLDKNVFAVSLHEEGYGYAKGYFKNGFIEHEGVKGENKVMRSFWANGGSGVFRRSYWMKLSGMDEKLLNPFYWEDLDICYRAAKRGWVILWEPDSLVYHEHEATIGKLAKKYKERIQQRNQLLFIWKNITSRNLFRKHLLGVFSRVVKQPGYIRIVALALLKIGLVLKERKREKRESKVSDEALLSSFS